MRPHLKRFPFHALPGSRLKSYHGAVADNPRSVASIGLGLLGGALASRLVQAGIRVKGFDLAPIRDEVGSLPGLEGAPSAGDAVRGQQLILLCLPNTDVSAAVLEEIEPHLELGSLVIDTTTGDPDQVARFGPRLAARGVEFVDATIGGSSEQASRGEVIAMVGATADGFERSKPLLELFSKQVVHVGGWGAGARMKLVMNLVIGLNRAVLAEALSFARRQDMDLDAVLETLGAGPSYSTALELKGEKMVREDFEPVARLSQHLKDVRLILEAGAAAGATLPLSQLHLELLELAEQRGYGASDNSAVIKAWE